MKEETKTPKDIQPLIETAYHLAEQKDGDAIVEFLSKSFGGIPLVTRIGMIGAWDDALELWKIAAEHTTNRKKMAVARHNLGVSYHQRGNWEAALKEY